MYQSPWVMVGKRAAPTNAESSGACGKRHRGKPALLKSPRTQQNLSPQIWGLREPFALGRSALEGKILLGSRQPVLLVVLLQSVENNSKVVPRRVCIHLLEP